MASFKIQRGFDLQVSGSPSTDISEAEISSTLSVYPHQVKRIKARSAVSVGDKVQLGSPLYFDKNNPSLQFRSPAAGTVSNIILGDRRSLHTITIERDAEEAAVAFTQYSEADLGAAQGAALLDELLQTGLIALIEERPFSKIPDITQLPKSIFINAMNTAPFQPSATVLLQGEEAAYRAGCAALKKFTNGRVFACSSKEGAAQLPNLDGIEAHTFSGPHPSGNTSTHIYHLDPISPGDTVWAVSLANLIQIGKFFLEGKYPCARIIMVAGNGALEADRKYYKVRTGTRIDGFIGNSLKQDTPVRMLRGDILSGIQADAEESVGMFENALNLLPNEHERLFMGWISPGADRYSRSPSYLSKWIAGKKKWDLTTSLNGSKRSIVLTGKYNEVMPLDIMVDFLLKAVLAHDTDEAIKLGILDTAPEDFALCSFVCPSKIDVCGIIQQGLDEIEEEGI